MQKINKTQKNVVKPKTEYTTCSKCNRKIRKDTADNFKGLCPTCAYKKPEDTKVEVPKKSKPVKVDTPKSEVQEKRKERRVARLAKMTTEELQEFKQARKNRRIIRKAAKELGVTVKSLTETQKSEILSKIKA